MATTVACVEPETAPKRVHAVTVAIGRPPLLCPTIFTTKFSSLSAICPEVIISAAKINIGTAVKEIG
ncbi:hypothetical protein SDC9_166027 [bioreactor metagenome]|uniref:Uncharacterized protein n=1 Tax=bioreactor metagenome TaxID=1076179 RepID=A0A645G3E5_9ZZZZ